MLCSSGVLGSSSKTFFKFISNLLKNKILEWRGFGQVVVYLLHTSGLSGEWVWASSLCFTTPNRTTKLIKNKLVVRKKNPELSFSPTTFQ